MGSIKFPFQNPDFNFFSYEWISFSTRGKVENCVCTEDSRCFIKGATRRRAGPVTGLLGWCVLGQGAVRTRRAPEGGRLYSQGMKGGLLESWSREDRAHVTPLIRTCAEFSRVEQRKVKTRAGGPSCFSFHRGIGKGDVSFLFSFRVVRFEWQSRCGWTSKTPDHSYKWVLDRFNCLDVALLLDNCLLFKLDIKKTFRWSSIEQKPWYPDQSIEVSSKL
jgi:hypothetical protein